MGSRRRRVPLWGFGGCICIDDVQVQELDGPEEQAAASSSTVAAPQTAMLCKSKEPSPGSVGSTGAPSSPSRSPGSSADSWSLNVMVEEQAANAPSEAASSVVSLSQSIGPATFVMVEGTSHVNVTAVQHLLDAAHNTSIPQGTPTVPSSRSSVATSADEDEWFR